VSFTASRLACRAVDGVVRRKGGQIDEQPRCSSDVTAGYISADKARHVPFPSPPKVSEGREDGTW
jgi:hypothetical protein